MGSDVSQANYRGILVPFSQVKADNLDAASSSYNEAGPLPGVPEPQNDSDLTLQATGTQSASKQLRVRAQKPGYPGKTGGGFVWQYQGDALYRGWDEPTVITAWEAVTWIDSGASSDTISTPHAVTLDDEQILLVYERHIASGPTAGYYIQARRRSVAGAWGAAVDVYSQATLQTDGYQPCLVLLPSGRVLIFSWLDDGSGVRNQVRMHYSDDKGDTWSLGSGACLKTPYDTSGSVGPGNSGSKADRLRAAYSGGEILLIAANTLNNSSSSARDGLRQYASDDLGASFLEVESDTSLFPNGYSPEVLALDGGFIVVSLVAGAGASGNDGTLKSRKIGTAFTNLKNAPVITSGGFDLMTRSAGAATAGELGVWLDDHGVLWAAIYDDITLVSCTLLTSTDNGDSWGGAGSHASATNPSLYGTGFWYYQADTGTYPGGWCAVSQGGRGVLLHSWTASPGNEDESIGAAYLGGYSTVTMPPHSSTSAAGLVRSSWDRTYLPFDIPSDVQWTGTGTATETIDSGYYQIDGSISTRRFNSQNPAGTVAEGITARAAFEVVSGGSLALNACALQLRTADGSADYQVTIRFSTTGFRVYDDNAAAAVGSDVTLDMTAGGDIIASISDGNFACWYRARSTSGGREYTAGPSSTTLTDGGGAAANHQITFGTLVNHNTTSRWYELHHVSDEWAGGSLAGGQSNPADLNTRAFSSAAVWVDDGVRLKALDGPALTGEVWNIDTRYTYPVGRIYPGTSPSPREKWRSTDETQKQIAWTFSEAWPTGVSMGIYLDGINWRLGSIEYWDGAAWQSSVTLDAATDRTGLPFTRTDGLVTPSSTAHTAEHYIERGELAEATVDLGSNVYRKVADNTAGLWTNATTKKPAVHLTGQQAGDPTTGTCNIWSPRVLAIQHKLPTQVQGIRLTINAQTTADGYFTLGAFVVAPVVIFGNDTSWGRALTLEPNVEVVTSREGARRSQKVGPARRAVEFAWADGVDAMHVQGKTPDPDYLTLDPSAAPLALRGEAMLMRDLVDTIDGPVDPVVYLPSVTGPSNYNEIRRQEYLYGRIMGGVRMEQVQGLEGEDEVFRIATITVEEEL